MNRQVKNEVKIKELGMTIFRKDESTNLTEFTNEFPNPYVRRGGCMRPLFAWTGTQNPFFSFLSTCAIEFTVNAVILLCFLQVVRLTFFVFNFLFRVFAAYFFT